ncbi:uncharacterized protein ACHE_10925A [Aspergillus chevalieri]|uniref:Uncharacterized protein n=1 Tax=Aspergillus chevalieri TaxID=182096 RepID=A0A7R7ZIQ9_ASPCH|nr:uncharacterized protein ACHE_10925A [Aspergillus chevalieri]BCR83523.1 hypothetical protein ACHE_10925A [Aspergillus chevalieri]
MSQAERTDQSSGAKYFGKTSPKELKELESNAARATPKQLAKAASYLEKAFSGMKTAWFGGWALKLRGSRRETQDLDFLVLVPSVVEVRTVLAQYSWAILAFYGPAGGVQERMFIDIDEGGQVVGVDIIISGAIGTPNLSESESRESIPPSFQTPQGNRVNVIHITWQVETKLTAWFARRKDSDFLDLGFLLVTYGREIAQWSQFLDRKMREDFCVVYGSYEKNKKRFEEVKKVLSL